MAQVRFAGLNDRVESVKSSDRDARELQVMKCLEMYNQVLHMQQKGAVAEAVGLYEQLLRMDALKGEVDPVPNIHSSPLHSLHFVVFKNYSLLLEPTEPSRAIDLRMRALRVDPSDVDLWFSLGDLAARHGDTVLAAEAFQLGLDRSVTKRQRALGLKGLALALYDLGDVEATLERLRSALEIDPGWENGAQLRRGIVAELLARDEARSGVIGRVTAVTASLPLADLLDQDAGPRAPLPERSMAQLALDIPAMVSKELEEPNFLALGRLLLSLHEGESESTSALEIIVRASNPESAPMEIPESPEPGPASPPPEEETPTTPRKRKTPADDDDRKVQRTAPAEDEGASSGEEEGKKKARRSGRTAKKVAAEPEATTVPGEAKKFALDESVEPEFLRRADLMLAPMSISFGSLNRDVPEYVSSVINRFLDVALGGWRRRGKKAKQADAPKATRRGDSSFTTPGPADPVWTDVGSLIDFVQSCTGKSLAEWSEAYLLRCLSAWTSCAYFEAMTEVVADLLARAEKGAVSFSDKLLKSALHGVGNQPALLLLSACELLVDQAANQMAEKVSSLVEVAVYPLLSLYTAKLDLLSLGGMDGLRRQWMQGKVRSMEGLIGEAGKAWEACLTGIGAGTLELANVRWDRHLSTQAIRSKMKGIEFRHRLEELDSAFQEKRFGEVLAGLGPMVGHGLASFSAGTDSSFSVADMEEFCSLAERIALLERFGTCVREQQLSTDLSWEVDVRLIGLLLDQLPNEGGTLDSLDKLIAAMSRLLNPLDSRTSAIAHLPAKDALASSILLANRLAVTMLLRWPEFVTQHAKPSPDKERLRRYSFSFVARAFRLLFHLAAAADPDPDEGTDPSSDWLDYCHQMMGARDVCDVDGSSILRLCLRRFRAAGADYADQVAQCYNCMYKVTLDPTILFEEHVTRPITLEKDSAEFVAGMVPRWREALVAGNSTTSERQHFLKTLEKVADALGDWASSPHVMQNLALLERFLAADVSLAEFAGQVATPPLISASALRSGGDPVPVAAFEIDYIRGCLVSMQVDPARFPLLPVEEPRDSRSMPSHRAQAIHMLAKEAIPMLKRNAAINWELFEAWWALGAAYAQLAWDLLGLENSHELSAIEDDIADYQKRALRALIYASNLLPAPSEDTESFFRPLTFPFYPKPSTLAADVYSHLGLLILSILSKPMRGLALAGSVREPKGWEERCRAQFAVAATSEKSAAENETEVLETPVGQQLARAMRLFALTCFRRAGAESPTEWQYPLLQAKLLAKLRKSHTDVLAAFAKALRIHKENAAAARSRDSAKKGPQIDVQLGILTYLAKTTDLPMEGVQAGLALLGSSSSTCAPPNRDEAAKRILSELVSLRRQDGHQANKASGWLPGFKVIYRIARLQLVISSDPRLALSELNPLLSNRLLRPFFKAYFNPPGSILRTVQQILELQVDCIISSRSEDEALALLSRICRTAPERHAFAAQLWDPDHVFKRLYDFTFSSLRAQDGFGTELVPVSPGMSTAFGKKLTRPHFERCAPQIEQSLSRLLAKEPADPLLHRRLGILAKLAELVRCRDVWHSGVSWLVVDTEEDSEVERMGVALYAWMWRSINADGAFDPPDEEKKKDKDGEKEKERSEVKLRFKVVSKRIATFLKSVDKFLPEELREGTEVKKRGRRKTMDPAQLETKREAGEPTEDKGEPTEEATLAEPSDPPSRADMTADGIENGGAAMDVDRHGEGPVDSPAPEEEIEEQ